MFSQRTDPRLFMAQDVAYQTLQTTFCAMNSLGSVRCEHILTVSKTKTPSSKAIDSVTAVP